MGHRADPGPPTPAQDAATAATSATGRPVRATRLRARELDHPVPQPSVPAPALQPPLNQTPSQPSAGRGRGKARQPALPPPDPPAAAHLPVPLKRAPSGRFLPVAVSSSNVATKHPPAAATPAPSAKGRKRELADSSSIETKPTAKKARVSALHADARPSTMSPEALRKPAIPFAQTPTPALRSSARLTRSDPAISKPIAGPLPNARSREPRPSDLETPTVLDTSATSSTPAAASSARVDPESDDDAVPLSVRKMVISPLEILKRNLIEEKKERMKDVLDAYDTHARELGWMEANRSMLTYDPKEVKGDMSAHMVKVRRGGGARGSGGGARRRGLL
ncbi:hypothetical protein BDK51DRAFT_40446 [Blyttiomyces helicus]|uniref:Uncharacterized protein n=1 Tax=Blyttiomyces helicus TaxID=388810 RepID=A0A4P9WHZ2_9FUNG|nr:hypothetical protein BDK51DRAFT_40446 [Blyttiomyces helicus]|eukprot:RKO92469.1 hypothetical protein BDK51DRAFT_40446 [Blyttiomyces helicus]